MAEIIRMPRMSDTMEEGVIIAWHKKEGDEVEPGDLLAEIETDKATMDFESPWDGFLLHIEIKEGVVPIDGIIAVIGEKGEDFTAALDDARKGGSAESEDSASIAEEKQPTPVSESIEKVSSTSADDKRIKASPLAKKMAADAGVNLADITGSGDHGRIIKKDIESFMSSPKPVEQVRSSAPVSIEGGYSDVPVNQMRKTIARRLSESKFTAPHFYLTIEINMDTAIAVRKDINAGGEVKISFNDFVMKAAAMALRKHPAINASWLGDRIRYNNDINIGVAVAVPDGLLVPVIRNTDFKSMSQINVEVKEMAVKAKNKKLQPAEMQGNTFTISNLGMFGISEFTAIINPPDSCILAIGGIDQKPIVKNGQIVPGNIMKVTMSCDHRVVDGATGAMFLQTFKKNLEQPANMLV